MFEIIDLIKLSYYVALVTKASVQNVADILNTFNKTSVSDKIFTQEDVSKMKPDPEGYLKTPRRAYW